MSAKLAVLIVALALCACALLSLRQMRTQSAHELAEARLRLLQRENEFWRLRTRIAAKVTPEHIQSLALQLTPLQSMPQEGSPGVLAGPVMDSSR